ncbi:MAG: hypothetical protein ACLQMF_00770 [Rectinemataceae bacterium]
MTKTLLLAKVGVYVKTAGLAVKVAVITILPALLPIVAVVVAEPAAEKVTLPDPVAVHPPKT